MRIGIILTGDYSWAGGLYYSLNIIKLLHKISLTKNIKIIVLVNRHTQVELLTEIKLQNVELVNFDNKTILYKLWCKFVGIMTSSNYRFVRDINSLKLDTLYPVINYEKGHERLNCKVYYWLYDFQHKFLPELFSNEELHIRDLNFEQVVTHAENIVVSSHDSKNHLNQFYPEFNSKIHVYNFVSLIEKPKSNTEIKVPENYFVVCNQFWPHKNHIVILKAVDLLSKKGIPVHIVFTGKYNDERNKLYVKELQNFIRDRRLATNVTFTGFIPREEQIALMKKAKAVIQPSLFEGWSTVIEDAKALNKFLIVSDIAIHREQITQDVLFFKPVDAVKLSDYLNDQFIAEAKITTNDYSKNIERSSSELVKMFGLI